MKMTSRCPTAEVLITGEHRGKVRTLAGSPGLRRERRCSSVFCGAVVVMETYACITPCEIDLIDITLTIGDFE